LNRLNLALCKVPAHLGLWIGCDILADVLGPHYKEMIMSSPAQAITLPRLRPLSIGDLLDEGVRLYRRTWIQLGTIAAIVTVPATVLQSVSTFLNLNTLLSPASPRYADSAFLSLAQLGQFVVGIVYGILQQLMLGAIVYAAGQDYLGHRVDTRSAYRRSARRYLVLLAASILTGLLLLALAAVTLIPCVGWLGGPPMIVFACINLLLLIEPVVMLEDQGAAGSLRRTWMLAKSQFWRVLLISFVLYLFNLALVGGPTYVVTVLAMVVTQSPAAFAFVNVATGAAVNLVFQPIWGVCMTLLYYDARVRREGLDLSVLMGDESPLEQVREPLFVRSDWKTMGILALLSLPGIALLMLGWWAIFASLFFAMQGAPR
jgi:hypothetical protein